MKIRIAGTVSESIVDGPGLRFVVFTQGCPHNCEGCQNPETHDFEGGKVVDTDELYAQCADDPLHDGVTFSGGEPFCQAEALYELGSKLKKHGLHLMCYSGWTYEELLKKAETEEFVGKLLSITDILVDGNFVLEKRSLSLKFRGSENQRVIDVQQSLKKGYAVLQNV
ncbi:MAG: anaerobic ribonucleoside-triphosphate reductase activating protein [Oscillospiraceae bacterium]|nr:anaerobic ribonucleoside-triphosphate reductase activating protein [Oscillospiraceae bacterium]